jgi:cysteinyl-tRNA synthetase
MSSHPLLKVDMSELSVAERIQLAKDLWDSVLNEQDKLPLTDAQKVEDGQIILTPVKLQRADAVREKLAELNITEQDVEDAVAWARQTPAPYPDKEAE